MLFNRPVSGAERHLADFLKDAPEFWLWRKAHGSISVQERQPYTPKGKKCPFYRGFLQGKEGRYTPAVHPLASTLPPPGEVPRIDHGCPDCTGAKSKWLPKSACKLMHVIA